MQTRSDAAESVSTAYDLTIVHVFNLAKSTINGYRSALNVFTLFLELERPDDYRRFD